MGTPDFAVGILSKIIEQNIHEIVAVITAPDKPAGRGQKIAISSVKEYALEQNLTILQPTNLKDETFLTELKAFNANLNIVVAFRMLPKAVWQMPEFGTFNLHASLLPNYRGAAPINWAIINGEKKTGVTTFFIDDKIDTGAIILNKQCLISETENVGQLHDKLMILGSEAVLETLDLISENKAITTLQTENETLKTAHKLNKENCKIDFTQNSQQIFNLIRGLNPYPGAWCNYVDNGIEQNIKIYEANFELENHNLSIGSIIISKKEMKIATLDGFLIVLNLQFPGKKKMQIHELLNGFKVSELAKFL